MLRLTCPRCKKGLRVDKSQVGNAVTCPSCSHKFRVGTSPTPPKPTRKKPEDDEDDEVPEVEMVEEAPAPVRKLKRRAADEEDDEEAPRRKKPKRVQEEEDINEDEADEEEEEERPRKKKKKPQGYPNTVLTAIAALVVMIIANLVSGAFAVKSGEIRLGGLIVNLVFSILVLIGMILGHRLSWQWGRVLGFVGALLNTLAAIGAASDTPESRANYLDSFAFAVIAACLWTIFGVFGTKSARKYFALKCPKCGSFATGSADFLFSSARCKECNREW